MNGILDTLNLRDDIFAVGPLGKALGRIIQAQVGNAQRRNSQKSVAVILIDRVILFGHIDSYSLWIWFPYWQILKNI